MKYEIKDNPLATWYRSTLARVRRNNSPIYPRWRTWFGFAKWAEENGYDENSELHCSALNPFTPEYLGRKRAEKYDCEYIAYSATDPYELIIASAPSIPELAEILRNNGYCYTEASIHTALSRNKTDRPIDERVKCLVFERVDLSNYNEDDEPFEERN